VRQFALERLGEAGEEAAFYGRHFTCFHDIAVRAESQLTGPEQGKWLSRLSQDHENLLTALGWPARDASGARPALRMATALSRYWSTRGHYELGLRVLEEALA